MIMKAIKSVKVNASFLEMFSQTGNVGGEKDFVVVSRIKTRVGKLLRKPGRVRVHPQF